MNTAVPASPASSPAATQRPSFLRDLVQIGTDLWQFRELLGQLAKRDIKIRYKQAAMGFAWALFMPLMVVLAGLIIRVAVASVGGDSLDREGAGGLILKGLCWSFFVGGIGFATPSLTGNMTLVSKIYFPREVLPIAALGAQAFDSAIGTVAVLLVLPFFGLTVSTALLWAPVLLLMLIGFTASAALFLSCANLFFRDVKYIVQVLLTFGIFFTPVLFEPAMLGAKGAGLVMFNPIAPILEGLRLAVIEGHSLLQPLTDTTRHGVEVLIWSPWYLAYAAAWSFGSLAISAVLFHRAEYAFAEFV